MSGAAHIGELDLRKPREKLVGAFLADDVADLAAHEKHRHFVAQDRRNGCIHAVDVGDLYGRKRRDTTDELRIPVPIPAITAAAQVGHQPSGSEGRGRCGL